MNLSKSIDFLLENAGSVIQYRLRKEILKNITPAEEAYWLEQIYQTPYFKLVENYAKPTGFIGDEMHGYSRGEKTRPTPLHDGESAARLLSHYAIPKNHKLVVGFAGALQNEEILREEFSNTSNVRRMFENRYDNLCNGGGLMVIIYTLLSMLGYGDDGDARRFQDISLNAFGSLLALVSLEQILKHKNSKKKYNYPYIENDTPFPCAYHLTTLAYTKNWRTPVNINLMKNAINHMDDILSGVYNGVITGDLVLKNGKGALWSLTKPFERFNVNYSGSFFRRFLTEIAMLGVGHDANVIRESAAAVEEALTGDGVLRLNYATDAQRKKSMTKYASCYGEIGLEPNHKKKTALDCDLTFWAVQFLHFANT